MTRGRALLATVLGTVAVLCSACTAAIPLALPPAPPRRSGEALARWRAPPPLAPDASMHLDWQVARRRLPGGLGVSAVSRPDSTTTAILLWVPAAADASEGLVAVMAEALRAGTATRTGNALVNPRIARQAISIRTDATGTTFSWHVLPGSTGQALDGLADFVLRPTFDLDQTRVVFQQELARIQRDSASLWHLANLARDAVAGLDLPSPASDALGLLEITPERLRLAHRCALQPRGAELVVVGPAPAPELIERAARAFEGFADPTLAPGECASLPTPASLDGAPPSTRVELQIVHGGTFDPFLVLVTPGPARSSPDYLPFTLAVDVLDSRDSASQGLRHSGATYSISAHVNDAFRGGTLLEIAGQVAPEEARHALRTLVSDIRNVHRTLQADELEKVKRRHATAFIDGLASNLALGTAALKQLQRGRSPEALERWPDELRGVSLERCRQVARRWLSRAEPSIAVAGVPVPLVRGLGFRANVRHLYWTDRLQGGKKAL
jgi:predicted Zn-dependent peptidase